MVLNARGWRAGGGARGIASAQARGTPWGPGVVAGVGGAGGWPWGVLAESDASDAVAETEGAGDGASTSFCNDPTAEPPAITPGPGRGSGGGGIGGA
ncbi:unnamed protein product, partial [Brenthis ino]